MKFIWTQSDQYARMNKSIKQYKSNNRNNLDEIIQIILDAQVLASSKLNLMNFDYFIAVTPENTTENEISTSVSFLQRDSKYINSTILGGDYWQSGQSWKILAHEIGHSLGLIDLYSKKDALYSNSNYRSFFNQFKFMGYFDIMNWPTGPAPEMTAWNRWSLGFLSKDEIKCLTEFPSMNWVSAIEMPYGAIKALFIKLDVNKLLVIEYRDRIGFDIHLPERSIGVLIYIVDFERESGAGALSIVFDNKNGLNLFEHGVLRKGEGLIIGRYFIRNLSDLKGKALVRITKF